MRYRLEDIEPFVNGEPMVRAALAGLVLTVLPTFPIGGLLRSGAFVELTLDGLAPTTDPVQAIDTQSRRWAG